MTDLKSRLPDNTPGKFYVDANCIDCQLCQDLAPKNFTCNVEKEHHIVSRQPENAQELEAVLDAMECCPVRAIGDDGEAADAAPRLLKKGA